MNVVIVSIVLFVLSFVAHAITHRVLLSRGVMSYVTTIVYAIGLCILLAYVFDTRKMQEPFVLTGIALYILFSLFVLYLYFSIFLAGQTPASIILDSFVHKRKQTYNQIQKHFSDKGLLVDRLDQLMRAHLVVMHNERLCLTSSGQIVGFILRTYQYIFHRYLTG